MRALDLAAGDRTLLPADGITRAALTEWDDTRVLVRLAIPELTDSDQWGQATDLLTGLAVQVRRADCGAGCRCAAEVRLVGVGAPTPPDLLFLWNEVLLAGDLFRQIDPGEVFGSMTCAEAEALAGIFTAAGDTATAEHIINSHGIKDDDPEDAHHTIYQEVRSEQQD